MQNHPYIVIALCWLFIGLLWVIVTAQAAHVKTARSILGNWHWLVVAVEIVLWPIGIIGYLYVTRRVRAQGCARSFGKAKGCNCDHKH